MLGKLINAYLDILFKFYAYVVGYLYLALPYSLSFIIPPLKRIINNFEEDGSNLSILIISLISGSALFYLFIVVDITDFSASKPSVFGLLGWYIGYFIWGYFALFLLADFRLKAKQKEIS